MPGTVDPEAICAQVIGNDTAILADGASSEFQLKGMQPLAAWNLLSGFGLLNAAAVRLNPSLVTVPA